MNTSGCVRIGLIPLFLASSCALGRAADPKPVTLRSATGTVDAINRDQLDVTLKQYGKVTVKATSKTTIRVKGAFGLDKIQPGMYLTFSGTIDGTTVGGEVEKATMFSLADGYKPGIVKIMEGAPQSISGKVEKVDGQEITVNAGRKLTATFSKEVEVNLDSGDISLVAPGCEIEIRGSLVGKSVNASYITFWLAKDIVKAQTATRAVIDPAAKREATAAAAAAKAAEKAKLAAEAKPDAGAKAEAVKPDAAAK